VRRSFGIFILGLVLGALAHDFATVRATAAPAATQSIDLNTCRCLQFYEMYCGVDARDCPGDRR
jgi:hypothetical protein